MPNSEVCLRYHRSVLSSTLIKTEQLSFTSTLACFYDRLMLFFTSIHFLWLQTIKIFLIAKILVKNRRWQQARHWTRDLLVVSPLGWLWCHYNFASCIRAINLNQAFKHYHCFTRLVRCWWRSGWRIYPWDRSWCWWGARPRWWSSARRTWGCCTARRRWSPGSRMSWWSRRAWNKITLIGKQPRPCVVKFTDYGSYVET